MRTKMRGEEQEREKHTREGGVGVGASTSVSTVRPPSHHGVAPDVAARGAWRSGGPLGGRTPRGVVATAKARGWQSICGVTSGQTTGW